MNTIAIANQKGGCGKTTTAINLAAELGNSDERVLLIDMDPQGHASLGLGISERGRPGLYEVFSDEASLNDVIVSDVFRAWTWYRQTSCWPRWNRCSPINPAASDNCSNSLNHWKDCMNIYSLIAHLHSDCCASMHCVPPTQVLTPVEASLYALEGVSQLKDIVNLLCEKYCTEIPIKAVPTMFDTHTRFAQTVLQQLHEQLPAGRQRCPDPSYGTRTRSGLLWKTAVRVRPPLHSGGRLPPAWPVKF